MKAKLHSSFFILHSSFAVLAAFSLQPSALLAQGSLTPPGAPAPTMKTLDQIEARTPILSASFTITNSGSYYLTTNLTVSSGDAITIATNGVTLDLNGFTISSTAPSPSGYAILLSGGPRDITIANGYLQGGVTNNGSGSYGGSGFACGIGFSGSMPASVLVSRVSVSGCGNDGLWLGTNNSSVVEFCTVRTVGSCGIFAATVRQSSAFDCGKMGIDCQQAFYCRGESSGTTGTWNGVNASRTAIGCQGISATGRGLSAQNAAFCTGHRPGGTAIGATVANGCYSSAGTNFITYKYSMP